MKKIHITDFIERDDLIQFQIDSYNWLIEKGLQEVIDERKYFEVNVPDYQIELRSISVKPPEVSEYEGFSKRSVMEYRIRNLTYASKMILTVNENGKDIDVEIGHIPVMLKSKICLLNGMSSEELIANGEDPEDPGGYFIINGTERVLVVVEDVAPNKIITTFDEGSSKKSAVAKVVSIRHGFRSRTTVEKEEDNDNIFVSFPGASKISLTFLMKALGFQNDEILELFSDEAKEDILPLLGDETPDDAFRRLSKKISMGHAEQYQVPRTEQTIDNFLLPHIGNKPENRRTKVMFLAMMANEVMKLMKKERMEDDKDHYGNKRVRLAGDLLQELFRVSFNMLLKDIKYQLEKQYTRKRAVSIKNAIRSRTMSERMDYAIATGNWTGGRAGISQVLDRVNYLSSIAHRRRVTSLLERSRPHFEARDLHATQWGRMSPNETPEGKNCGLVKNLAIGAVISRERDDTIIKDMLIKFGVK